MRTTRKWSARPGEAPGRIHLVDGPDGGADVQVRDPARVAWLSQTTLSVDETLQTVAALRERFPMLADPPSDDICYATQNRQVAVKKIATDSDLVIVVGSANSSNSVRLVEVALDAGAPAAYLVEDATAIDPAWLDGVQHGRADQRRLGSRGTRKRRAGVPGGTRVRHRRGGRGGRGAARVRAAPGAAPHCARADVGRPAGSAVAGSRRAQRERRGPGR